MSQGGIAEDISKTCEIHSICILSIVPTLDVIRFDRMSCCLFLSLLLYLEQDCLTCIKARGKRMEINRGRDGFGCVGK